MEEKFCKDCVNRQNKKCLFTGCFVPKKFKKVGKRFVNCSCNEFKRKK